MKSNEMEFIDEVCTQMLELEFGQYYHKQGKGTDKETLYLTDEAQDFYNNRYDEIETLYENLIVPKINPLEWFNHFVDYMQEMDPDMYNRACEYADYEEKQSINLKKLK